MDVVAKGGQREKGRWFLEKVKEIIPPGRGDGWMQYRGERQKGKKANP